ncbi:Plasma membrane fusion protein PRM1 [Bienertia sinuspersici]
MATLKADCTTPCLMFGDINEMISLRENEGGAIRSENLGFKGGMFTWQRGNNPDTFIRERLDRFLEACKEKNKQRKVFKFEALWLSRDGCWNVVSDAWKEFMSMDILLKSNYANKLTEWATETFRNINRRIKEAEKGLRFFQDQRPDQHMLSKCKEFPYELDELHRLEEYGDKNTTNFHHKASQRQRCNFIKGIYDDRKKLCTNVDDIAAVVTIYYDELFKSTNPSNFDDALAGLQCLVSEQMNKN